MTDNCCLQMHMFMNNMISYWLYATTIQILFVSHKEVYTPVTFQLQSQAGEALKFYPYVHTSHGWYIYIYIYQL